MNTLKNHLTSAQDAIKTHANKALASTALLTTLTLGSCGHKAPSTEQSDSTAVKTEVVNEPSKSTPDTASKSDTITQAEIDELFAGRGDEVQEETNDKQTEWGKRGIDQETWEQVQKDCKEFDKDAEETLKMSEVYWENEEFITSLGKYINSHLDILKKLDIPQSKTTQKLVNKYKEAKRNLQNK